MLLVFRRQVAEFLFEEFGELLGRHANLVSNLRNAVPALLQQRLAPLQANGAHELQRALASDLHQLLVQATAAEAQAVAEVLNGEVRIVHLLLHDLYGFPDEFLVDGADRDFGGRYVHHLELAVILLRPSQLLLDAQQEYFEVERLGDVIIRPFLQPVEHMFLCGSRRQQDNGDMRIADVVLDATTQLHAVHYGHHDIADDQVHRLLLQHLQGLLAVTRLQHPVLVLQAADQKLPEILVVLHDKEAVVRLLSNLRQPSGSVRLHGLRLLRLSGCLATVYGDKDTEDTSGRVIVRQGDGSPMQGHVFLDYVQADAATHVGSVRMRFLEESVENLRLILILDTDSCVCHPNARRRPVGCQYLVHGDSDASPPRGYT